MPIVREAGGPLPVRVIAVRALAAKGVTLPDPHTMKRTRVRLPQTFVSVAAAGLVVKVGEGWEG